MSDIFREVEEDVRRERLEKLWKQYGDYIIAAVAAVAVGVAGYKLWDRYEFQQRLNAAKLYVVAQQAAEQGNVPAAQQSFAKLAKSGPSGYATMAKLSQANSLLAAGKPHRRHRDLQIHRRRRLLADRRRRAHPRRLGDGRFRAEIGDRDPARAR